MKPLQQTANKIFLTLLFIIVVTTVFFVFYQKPQPLNIPTELLAAMRPVAVQLKPFTLVDHNNRPFSLDRLKNKNSLLFFGYTSCPDICPTTLTTLNLLINKLELRSKTDAMPQVVFISVDTQRDEPEKLASYTTYFNKDFISITGDKEAIDSFAQQFSAGYVIENKTSTDNYQISHTSSIFMVDSDAKLIAAFSPPHDVDTLLEQYSMIRDLYLGL